MNYEIYGRDTPGDVIELLMSIPRENFKDEAEAMKFIETAAEQLRSNGATHIEVRYKL